MHPAHKLSQPQHSYHYPPPISNRALADRLVNLLRTAGYSDRQTLSWGLYGHPHDSALSQYFAILSRSILQEARTGAKL